MELPDVIGYAFNAFLIAIFLARFTRNSRIWFPACTATAALALIVATIAAVVHAVRISEPGWMWGASGFALFAVLLLIALGVEIRSHMQTSEE